MRKAMVWLVTLALVALGVFWLVSAPTRVVRIDDPKMGVQGDPKIGRDIFFAGGCASCHATPNQPDRLLLGGGLEMKSPYGSFYAPNISPHPTDGIGRWSIGDLANAMMAGVSPTGAHYYPSFPYTSYAGMRIDDVRHLMAFIRTLKPVEGRVRDHDLAFPYNIRRTLGIWKRLFLDTTPVRDDPGRSASWNRGRYLVETLSHCAECHSPRNALGAVIQSQKYAGGPDPLGRGWVPNITPHAIKNWSRGEMVQLLSMGLTPDGDTTGGSMAAVVKNTAELPRADLEAMAEYVLSLPPRQGPARPQQR